MGVTAAVWVHEGEAALRWHLPFQHFVNLYALCRGHTQINLRNPETDHVKWGNCAMGYVRTWTHRGEESDETCTMLNMYSGCTRNRGKNEWGRQALKTILLKATILNLLSDPEAIARSVSGHQHMYCKSKCIKFKTLNWSFQAYFPKRLYLTLVSPISLCTREDYQWMSSCAVRTILPHSPHVVYA